MIVDNQMSVRDSGPSTGFPPRYWSVTTYNYMFKDSYKVVARSASYLGP